MWVLSCKIEIFKAKISTSYSWYPSLTCIHYASLSISVCSFRERIYSLTRVNFKVHDPCEVLARIWKAQNSPRLLPWIYSVLRLKYAEPTKLTVFKSSCKGAKKLQQKVSSCEGAKKLQQKISSCERAKKLQH